VTISIEYLGSFVELQVWELVLHEGSIDLKHGGLSYRSDGVRIVNLVHHCNGI
jgi:hypothetical protein